MSNELATINTAEQMRVATDAAGVCKSIVTRTAMEIQGRKYVRVEGWMALATAHGCVASSKDVARVDGGFRAIGEIRRISDGALISTAEGFVGEDEPTWFGGEVETRYGPKTLPKRADYAIRAMAQTRAISRACRSAFAHVVVLMDAGLSTTPAEEVPMGGFHEQEAPEAKVEQNAEPIGTPVEALPPREGGWRGVPVPKFVKKGQYATVGELPEKDLRWWAANYTPKEFRGAIQPADLAFRAALTQGVEELDAIPADLDGTN